MEDNYPLANDPDGVPGERLHKYDGFWSLMPDTVAGTVEMNHAESSCVDTPNASFNLHKL